MNEIQRLQQLAGILTEIKVNAPGRIQFDYEEIDDDGEMRIFELSKDGETWKGNELYEEEPGFFDMEFYLDEEDPEYSESEQQSMVDLESLLDKHNIPYERISDGNGELVYIRIPKDKLDLR